MNSKTLREPSCYTGEGRSLHSDAQLTWRVPGSHRHCGQLGNTVTAAGPRAGESVTAWLCRPSLGGQAGRWAGGVQPSLSQPVGQSLSAYCKRGEGLGAGRKRPRTSHPSRLLAIHERQRGKSCGFRELPGPVSSSGGLARWANLPAPEPGRAWGRALSGRGWIEIAAPIWAMSH